MFTLTMFLPGLVTALITCVFCVYLLISVACCCTMPPKREVISLKKDDPLTLTCEWQDCQEVFEVMTDFLLHVTDHLEGTATSEKHNDECKCPQVCLLVSL